MKKKFAFIFGILLAAAMSVSASAAEGLIRDGRTLVGVRGVFEELGFGVDWDNETGTALIYDDTHNVSLTKGAEFFVANGQEVYPDVAQQIIDGRFYLPLRAVGESIGANIGWDAETKTAYISYNGKEIYIDCASGSAAFYTDYPAVPDLGACYGRTPDFTTDTSYGYYICPSDGFAAYIDILEKNGFTIKAEDTAALQETSGSTAFCYTNGSFDVMFGTVEDKAMLIVIYNNSIPKEFTGKYSYYKGFLSVPDFGSVYGISPLDAMIDDDGTAAFFYNVENIEDLDDYTGVLEYEGFEYNNDLSQELTANDLHSAYAVFEKGDMYIALNMEDGSDTLMIMVGYYPDASNKLSFV